MRKSLLATALVLGTLGGALALPNEPAARNAGAELALVLRCLGPVTTHPSRPDAWPRECDILFWTNLRPVCGWYRTQPVPPGARRTSDPWTVPPATFRTPLPLPDWISTLGHMA